MKHSIFLLVVLTIISAQTAAQNYGLDNVDPALFSKYRIPETDLSSLWFNTNLRFSSNKSINNPSSNSYYSYSNSLSTSFNSSLSPQYFLLKESDDRVLTFNINVVGIYDNNYSKYNYPTNSFDNFNKSVNSQLNLAVDGNLKNYLTSSNVFYSFSSDLQLNISDQKNGSSDQYYSSSYTGTKTQSYKLAVGAGWGRLRNVTPVVSAIRFQERLKQINLLNNDLNEKTIEDLAELFSKMAYYSDVYDRSAKYFWQEVDRVLATDGVSLSGLNQYGSSYIREVPNELRFLRYEGFTTGLNLQLSYFKTFSSNNPSPQNEQIFTLGNAYLNFSHQLNLNSQISFDLSLSGGPNIAMHPTTKQQYLINTDIGYNYELTDRIVTSVKNTFSLSFLNAQGQTKNLTNKLQLSLNYFVEDKMLLNTTYELSYMDTRYPYLTNSVVHNYISVGFSYYIERGFLYK